MAKSFTDHDGDIRQVLITMVTAKEFWNQKNVDSKVKSPFELAVSSVRALNADVKHPDNHLKAYVTPEPIFGLLLSVVIVVLVIIIAPSGG